MPDYCRAIFPRSSGSALSAAMDRAAICVPSVRHGHLPHSGSDRGMTSGEVRLAQSATAIASETAIDCVIWRIRRDCQFDRILAAGSFSF
jgi:hypothetical protein